MWAYRDNKRTRIYTVLPSRGPIQHWSNCATQIIIVKTTEFRNWSRTTPVWYQEWSHLSIKISSLSFVINIACKLTPVLLYISNLEINVSLMYSIYRDVPAINLSFHLESRIFKQFLISCFNWRKNCFTKKIPASKVLRDVYGNLIRYDQVNPRSVLLDQVTLTWGSPDRIVSNFHKRHAILLKQGFFL